MFTQKILILRFVTSILFFLSLSSVKPPNFFSLLASCLFLFLSFPLPLLPTKGVCRSYLNFEKTYLIQLPHLIRSSFFLCFSFMHTFKVYIFPLIIKPLLKTRIYSLSHSTVQMRPNCYNFLQQITKILFGSLALKKIYINTNYVYLYSY